MMRMRLSLVVLAAALLSALQASGQSPVVVNVRLTQPPPNQLRIADLWKVSLENRSGRPVTIYLHGTAEELSVPDGIIADARSKEFVVQPGSYVVTGRDVQPVDVDEYDKRYYDALLRTGTVPTGEYKVCCEAIDVETGAIVGSDCKYVTVSRLSVPILISPPDESEVVEKYPVFTWMASVPPVQGQVINYEITIAEVFGTQTGQDAVARNPAWFKQKDLTRTILQYPISSRGFEVGRKYAWMIRGYEYRLGERGQQSAVIDHGVSEVWTFTYQPPDGRGDDDQAGGRKAGGAGVVVVPTDQCPGENWDFEIGSLACWEVTGEAFATSPIKDAHVVLGSNGHNGLYWVTSYGAFDADKAKGAMMSQEFKIQNSSIAFLFGGASDQQSGVELLVEKLEKDTFSFPTRAVPGSAKAWYIAASTSARNEAGGSERLVPVEWDVLKFLNRNARILVRDSSEIAHLNVDRFKFYDREDVDTVKYPVLVMAAGENHSLAATPVEKPSPSLIKQLRGDVVGIKGGNKSVAPSNVVNQTTPGVKGKVFSAMSKVQSQPSSGGEEGSENDMPNLKGVQLVEGVEKSMMMSSLAGLIKQKNMVWAWGDNDDKAVGPQLGSIVKEPSKVKDLLDVQALAAGPWHSFAVGNDGVLKAWGGNRHAQLGTNDRISKSSPTVVNNIAKVNNVATGAFHTIASTDDGSIYAWGWNVNHVLGKIKTENINATSGQVVSYAIDSTPSPVSMQSLFKSVPLKNVVDVAAGEAHSLALTAAGNVVAWGTNDKGQTGRDMEEPVTATATVVKIGNVTGTVVAIAAGFDHSLALTKDGRVWAWGGNASGQLGDGTVTDRSKANAVNKIAGIRAIAAGSGFSLALDSLGNVWAWGNNVLGQLGDGTRIGKYEPVKVGRMDAVQGIVAGGAHALAVRADGSLWTWGTNDYGQLGEGPVTNLLPVPLDPPLGPLRVEHLAESK